MHYDDHRANCSVPRTIGWIYDGRIDRFWWSESKKPGVYMAQVRRGALA
jgi:hypothetical protein